MDEINVLQELQDFVILTPEGLLPGHKSTEAIQPSTLSLSMPSTSKEIFKGKPDFKWSVNETKMLLDLYGEYKSKVGSFAIKNHKQLWKIISEKLKVEMKIVVTEQNCQNRWRVLERNYKKFIDSQNSTGGGKKFFEYKDEMEFILGGKKSVCPELLLSSEQIHNLDEMECISIEEDNLPRSGENVKQKYEEVPEKNRNENSQLKSGFGIKNKKMKARKSCLELMREDRKLYYEECLKIQREKLEELKKRNKLIEDRNIILKERNCKCV